MPTSELEESLYSEIVSLREKARALNREAGGFQKELNKVCTHPEYEGYYWTDAHDVVHLGKQCMRCGKVDLHNVGKWVERWVDFD